MPLPEPDIRTLSFDPSLPRSGEHTAVQARLERDAVLAKRFVIERPLGEGGMGVVYAAYDRQTGERVALKTLPGGGAAGVMALKREFRALADVAHENLVALHELFADDGTWFFTMELVLGEDFVQHVRHVRVLPRLDANRCDDAVDDVSVSGERRIPRLGVTVRYDALRTALVGLVRGVGAIHAAGKLHRDLKPSNVVVTPEGRVVVLDFGLVGELSRSRGGVRDRDISGTPAYMAPEQVLGATSPASDWYSVGVMLFEALTGRLPFSGDAVQIFADKQVLDVPDVRDLVVVPEDLAVLVDWLTRRSPALRPTAPEILKHLGVGDANPVSVPVTAHLEGHLVGRDRELAELRSVWDEARAGRPAVALVEGPSGIGKTALIEEMLKRLPAETRVFRGRCFEREAMPFKAVDGVVDEIARALGREPLGRELPEHLIAALTRVFPIFGRVPGFKEQSALDAVREPLEQRRAGFAALGELLARLARERPVVVVVDDLQWGDVDGAHVLGELLDPEGPRGVCYVLGYRSEDALRSPCLRALMDGERGRFRVTARVVSLGPLSLQASEDLLGRLLGRVGDDSLARLAELGGGNPILLGELAAHADRVGIDSAKARRLSLAEILSLRIAALPEASRRLLDIAALAGRPILLLDALRASGLALSERSAAVRLSAERLVGATRLGDQSAVVVESAAVRSAVVDAFDDRKRAVVHGKIADALLASDTASPEMLVDHLAGAGRHGEALDRALAAAESARTALAYETEAALYDRARQWVAPERAQELRLRSAEALGRAGRLAEAARLVLEAVDHAEEAERGELRRLAAEHLVLSGHLEEGVVILDEALSDYGLQVPPVAEDGGADPALMQLIMELVGRGLAFSERPADEIPPGELRKVDLLWAAGWGLHLSSYRGRPFLIRHLMAALDAGEIGRIVRGLSLYVQVLSAGGIPTAPDVLRVLEGLTADRDDPWSRFWTEYARLGHHRYFGRAVTAVVHGAEAEAALRALPSIASRELGSLHAARANHLLSAGEAGELIRNVPGWLADARARGDLFGTVWMLGHHSYVDLLRDDPDRARAHLDEGDTLWGRPEADDMQHTLSLLQRLRVALYVGDRRQVRERLDAVVVPEKFMASPFFAAYSIAATAPARLFIHDSAPDSDENLAEIAHAADTVEGFGMETEGPLAPILRAGIASLRGQRSEALTELDRAADLAERPEARMYRDLVAMARRHLADDPATLAACRAAEERLRAEGVRNPARWVDHQIVLR